MVNPALMSSLIWSRQLALTKAGDITHVRNSGACEEEDHEKHKWQWPRMVSMRKSRDGGHNAASGRQTLLPVRSGDNEARDRDSNDWLHDSGVRVPCLVRCFGFKRD